MESALGEGALAIAAPLTLLPLSLSQVGPGIMNADLAVCASVGEEHCFGCLKHPTGPVPDVDLHAHGVSVDVDFVRSARHFDCSWDIRRPIVVARLDGRGASEQEQSGGCLCEAN